MIMDTTIKLTKRKVIDIPEDIFRFLSVKAAMQGTNLKRYIESLLAKDVEDMIAGMDDSEAYRWLSKHEPDGHVKVGEKEKQDFENLESEITYYENLLKSMSGQQGVDGYVKKLKELRAERDILLKEKGKGISEQFISSLKEIDISEFDRYISELEKRIKGKGENAKVKMRLPIDVKGSLSDEALFEVKDIKTLIDTAKSTRQSRIEAPQRQTTYQDDLAKAKLLEGKKLLGTFFSMGNPSAMECLGYTGMDFSIIEIGTRLAARRFSSISRSFVSFSSSVP